MSKLTEISLVILSPFHFAVLSCRCFFPALVCFHAFNPLVLLYKPLLTTRTNYATVTQLKKNGL